MQAAAPLAWRKETEVGRAVVGSGSGAAALPCTEQCGFAVAAHRGCAARYKEAFAKVGSSACSHLCGEVRLLLLL